MATSTDRAAAKPATRAFRRPWSARHVLGICALSATAHGLALSVVPGLALEVFRASNAGAATYWLRSSGVLFLAVAIVFAAAARWPASMMQRPVLLAAFVLTAALSVTGTVAMMDGVIGVRFAFVVASHGLLALWSGWLLITDRV